MTALDLFSYVPPVRVEVRPVDPHVPKADRKRLTGQNAAILEALRQGPRTNAQLAAICLNSRARISDLRAYGFEIECIKGEGGLNTYKLTKDIENVTPIHR